MILIARSSALIDFIKNICYNLYIKQKEKCMENYVWLMCGLLSLLMVIVALLFELT
mgnify:CR=1 FL=1